MQGTSAVDTHSVQRKRWSKLGILSLIVGIVSGPIALTAALLAAANHLPESTKEILGLVVVCVTIGIALAFEITTFVRLRRREATLRGQKLATTAIIITCLWVAYFILTLCALAYYGEAV
jgi:hypothetical protein